ncbi:MAG: energy transducer TonB [Acidobacteria bacterium]|nr:energy transducer TonB [Acidobacteriota bacterium]
MFADSLLEASWAQRSRRGWSTLFSFGVQAFALTILLFLPLYYTGALPRWQTTAPLYVPPALPSMEVFRAKRAHAASVPRASDLTLDGHLAAPPTIPDHVAQIVETSAPVPVDLSALSNDPNARSTGPGHGGRNGIPGGMGDSLEAAAPPLPPIARPPRISHMMEGNLIYRVQPVYPALARQARIQGEVVLFAVISREGVIERLQVLSGHPMLVPAALEAVRRWRYRPYVLNGEPIEVDTQVTVNFHLFEN